VAAAARQQAAEVVGGVVAGNVLLGIGFYAVDLCEAGARQQAAEVAADLVRGRGGTVWYLGNLGFPYHAEGAGMRRAWADPQGQLDRHGELRKGDWIVMANTIVPGLEEQGAEAVFWVGVSDPLPFGTTPCFYATPIAVKHHEGPRIWAVVWHVTADIPARAPP
jgi:hypothetical protein